MAEALHAAKARAKAGGPAPARSAPHHEALQRRAAAREAGHAVLLNSRPPDPQPIQRAAADSTVQAKKIWRDGIQVDVADDHKLVDGEERYSPEQLGKFRQAGIGDRGKEVAKLKEGFVTMSGGAGGKPARMNVQPPPRVAATLALFKSRFDTSQIENEQDRDAVDVAMAGTTQSPTHNRLAAAVGDDLLGRMMRNANRAGNKNAARQAFNATPPVTKPLSMIERPDLMEGAEDASIGVKVSKGQAPHFNPATNSISLMNPGELDQTSHELRHAYDQTHGELDLDTSEHRIASELNAFTQQEGVAKDLTGKAPAIFEGRTPKEMAKSYEGKEAKGYPGTLETSLKAVEDWRKDKKK